MTAWCASGKQRRAQESSGSRRAWAGRPAEVQWPRKARRRRPPARPAGTPRSDPPVREPGGRSAVGSRSALARLRQGSGVGVTTQARDALRGCRQGRQARSMSSSIVATSSARSSGPSKAASLDLAASPPLAAITTCAISRASRAVGAPATIRKVQGLARPARSGARRCDHHRGCLRPGA